MAEPVTGTALALNAVGSIAGGMAGASEAKAAQLQAQTNAFIGETRALQTDAAAREGMESELAQARAAIGVGGLNSGTFGFLSDIREKRGRGRSIAVGNERAQARDQALRASVLGRSARFSMLGGVLGAAPNIFSVAENINRGSTKRPYGGVT